MTTCDQTPEHELSIAYGQALLAPLDVYPIYDKLPGSVVMVTDHDTAIIILTGIAGGTATVQLQMCDKPPQDPAPRWEVVEEVDLMIESPLLLSSPTMEDGPPEPVLTPTIPGRHRVRVCGLDRNEQAHLSVMTSSEKYLVQAWPTTEATERQLLRDDGYTRG